MAERECFRGSRVDTRWYRDTELARTSASSMAAKLTPMQLRAATQRRNSYITAGVAFSMVGGVYYYTMQAMSGAPLPAAATVWQLGAPQPAARSGVRKRP